MSFEPGTAAYAVEINRIENLVAWKEEAKLTEEDKLLYRDYLLVNWEKAKAAIEAAKTVEMEWRKKAVAFAFNPEQKSGTERIELGNGYEAKAVKKINYGFIKNSENKTDKDKIEEALEKIEKLDPAGAYIADHLIKWTPELSLTEYKKLAPNLKAIIDTVIVTSEGAPTLEIIPPKGK